MEIDYSEIDINSLRNDLINYFTGAYFNASPVALMDMIEIENASDYQIIQIALDNNFDLNDYLKGYCK